MKKKFSIIMLAIMLVLSLVGCGSKLNDHNTETAKSIIETVDLYLDGHIDAEMALNKIDEEHDNIDEYDENSTERTLLSSGTTIIATELFLFTTDNGGDVEKIITERNNIADLVGESKYK